MSPSRRVLGRPARWPMMRLICTSRFDAGDECSLVRGRFRSFVCNAFAKQTRFRPTVRHRPRSAGGTGLRVRPYSRPADTSRRSTGARSATRTRRWRPPMLLRTVRPDQRADSSIPTTVRLTRSGLHQVTEAGESSLFVAGIEAIFPRDAAVTYRRHEQRVGFDRAATLGHVTARDAT